MAAQRSTLGLLTLAVIGMAVPIGVVPTATAHCNAPGFLPMLWIVDLSTCYHNDEIESVVDALNEASDGTLVYVLVKDKDFHPPVVRVKSGGTVTMVYADQEWNEQHDPKNSNLCANGVNPVAQPRDCVPSGATGNCFNFVTEVGGTMSALGDTYELTFRYTPATGAVQKANGILAGTLPNGPTPLPGPFKTCASNVAYRTTTEAVIPYHCAIHGVPGKEDMRATIIVEAA